MSQFRPQTQLSGIDSLLKEECVFLGTGYISRQSLEALQTVFSIEAVISKSDRLVSGHSQPTAVSQWALEHNTPLHHADTAEEIQDTLQSTRLRSQLAVVIDYGVLIPQTVIDYFPLGIINSHFSLLPQYRGPNPIRAAILAGDQKTGVTLIQITAGLDEGPVVAQEEVSIANDDTTPALTEKLIKCNSTLLTTELLRYARGEITPSPQDESQASWSTKTKKEDGVIDWTQPATQIEREIRAYVDWPKSRAKLADREVVITKARMASDEPNDADPGSVTALPEESAIVVQTGDGRLHIEKLKPVGKKEMTAAEFIRGYLQ